MFYFITSTIGRPDGGSQAASDILVSLLANDWPVTVVSGDNYDTPKSFCGEAIHSPHWVLFNLRSTLFPRALRVRLPKDLARWFWDKWRDYRTQTVLYKTIKSSPPTIAIFNGFPKPNSNLFNIFERSGAIIVIVVHSAAGQVEFFQKHNKDLSLNWIIGKMQRAASLIFVSPQIQREWLAFDQLHRKTGFSISNCCREEIANALVLQERSNVRRRLGLPIDRFVLVCVGKVDPAKGQDILIDALHGLIKVALDLLVCIVGNHSSVWATNLRDSVVSKGYESYVRFLGVRSDALNFTYAADLLVLPSRAEGQGIVILEAMCLKTAVMASDVGGIPSLIQHRVNGLLFPPEDPGGLVEAFTEMYTNSARRQSYADCSYELYWANFSRRRQKERYGEVIREICNRTRDNPDFSHAIL